MHLLWADSHELVILFCVNVGSWSGTGCACEFSEATREDTIVWIAGRRGRAVGPMYTETAHIPF
jgi:hypothetical protein